MQTRWAGCGTALVTPFRTDGAVDEAAVGRLARRQIDGGAHFLVPCGTTGESPTLSPAEKLRVVELVVEAADGAVPVSRFAIFEAARRSGKRCVGGPACPPEGGRRIDSRAGGGDHGRGPAGRSAAGLRRCRAPLRRPRRRRFAGGSR